MSAESNPENTAELEMPLSARDTLEALAETGEYLFHGSANLNIVEFEPRQAHNYNHETGESLPDGPPAVFAADRPDLAIFMALVNRPNSIDYKNGSSGFGIKTLPDGRRVAEFRATQNLINGARLPSARGVVYVVRRADFEQRDEGGSEWWSHKPVVPAQAIEVRSSDFPEHIDVIHAVEEAPPPPQ